MRPNLATDLDMIYEVCSLYALPASPAPPFF